MSQSCSGRYRDELEQMHYQKTREPLIKRVRAFRFHSLFSQFEILLQVGSQSIMIIV